MKSYKKLLVYQRMLEMVGLVYKLTTKLPTEEKYGLVSQMRRAAVSVISNFAEGYLKTSAKEKRLYLERSFTSLLELEAQADICRYLEFWSSDDEAMFSVKCGEVGFLLCRYRNKVV